VRKMMAVKIRDQISRQLLEGYFELFSLRSVAQPPKLDLAQHMLRASSTSNSIPNGLTAFTQLI
jgi:hypothetical protein